MITHRFKNGAWEWPDTLAPLMEWAEKRLIDVYSFKTDRQAFFLIISVAKQKMKFPKAGQTCAPHLFKLQRTLCPHAQINRQMMLTTRVHGIGTLGPASECRKVSIEEYLKAKGGTA